jgi:hypothetical protein
VQAWAAWTSIANAIPFDVGSRFLPLQRTQGWGTLSREWFPNENGGAFGGNIRSNVSVEESRNRATICCQAANRIEWSILDVSGSQTMRGFMPTIYRRMRAIVALIVIQLTCVGCSMTVSAEHVYGTYVARYPFGIDTITLNRDGSFLQHVAVGREQPASVRGTWEFDPTESRATFYGAIIVADNFDHLRPDWRTPTKGIVSLDVERHWFRVVMGSASTYPYVKR